MAYSKTVNFTTPASFTYSTSEIAVASGGTTLLDARRTFAATFDASSATADYGLGTLTGTTSGATFSAGYSGQALNLTGGTAKYAYWSATGNADFTTKGTIEFWYKPNYTGTPVASRDLFFLGSGASNENALYLYHASGSGSLYFDIFDATGTRIILINFGAWAPVAGTWYHFSSVLNLVDGANLLRINGAQKGTTNTTTGTRGAGTRLVLGSNYALSGTHYADQSYDNVIVYNTDVRTADFTAPPTFSSTIIPASGTYVDGLSTFSAITTLAGSDNVKYQISFAGATYWYTGGAWTATSSIDYAHANTSAEILAAISSLNTLVSSGGLFNVRAHLYSANAITTPTLSSVSYDYDTYAPTPSDPYRCTVTCWLKDILGANITSSNSATLKVTTSSAFEYGQFLIGVMNKSVTFNSIGYCEIELIETQSIALSPYLFTIEYYEGTKKRTITFNAAQVPNSVTADLPSFTTVAT